jgi:hypothetical protein
LCTSLRKPTQPKDPDWKAAKEASDRIVSGEAKLFKKLPTFAERAPRRTRQGKTTVTPVDAAIVEFRKTLTPTVSGSPTVTERENSNNNSDESNTNRSDNDDESNSNKSPPSPQTIGSLQRLTLSSNRNLPRELTIVCNVVLRYC